MPSEFVQAVTRAAYGARQIPRMAWYIGHSLVLRELAARFTETKSGRWDTGHTPMRQCATGSASMPT